MSDSNYPQPTPEKTIGAKILSIVVALGFALCVFGIVVFLTSCESRASQSQLLAQPSRIQSSLEFLGEYRIPNNFMLDGVKVGGLSGLTYDPQKGLFYAISDDRSNHGPARFYTLRVLTDNNSKLQKVEVLKATTLKGMNGKTYPANTIDTEAIALSPRNTVFITSEGDRDQNIPPMIGEFDLTNGQLKQQLKLSDRYLPDKAGKRGVQNNLAFESLTIASAGMASDPMYMFAATENPLMQDQESEKDSQLPQKNRWLHYMVGEQSGPLADYAYQLETPPLGALEHGLSEIQAIDNGGNFLTLERSLSLLGFKIKIFQATTGGATDVTKVSSLAGNKSVASIRKKLLLDLDDLKIRLDNIEGMAIGPTLPTGGKMVLMVSDNNFRRLQVNQVLLFRLRA
jgi:hypothetical protein